MNIFHIYPPHVEHNLTYSRRIGRWGTAEEGFFGSRRFDKKILKAAVYLTRELVWTAFAK